MRFSQRWGPKTALKTPPSGVAGTEAMSQSGLGSGRPPPAGPHFYSLRRCHNVSGGYLLSCAICEIRKEKRFCPAVHGRICPQCCGEQREVTLDCPSDCPYLQQAREHEKPRSPDQFDPAGLFLQIEVSDQFMYEKEHLLMGLTYALAKAARTDRSLNDQDLIASLTTLATSYERRINSGLHYEAPLTSESQRRAAAEVETMIK